MQSYRSAREACYQINLTLTCQQRRSELLLDNLQEAACLVEETCALELQDYFACILVDEVSLIPGSSSGDEQSGPVVTVNFRARGIQPLLATAHLDLFIEGLLSCALAQLFESLHVEQCAVA